MDCRASVGGRVAHHLTEDTVSSGRGVGHGGLATAVLTHPVCPHPVRPRQYLPGLPGLLAQTEPRQAPEILSGSARMPVAQLYPAHGARLLKCDRSCWKSGFRSARFTNTHYRWPSAPPQKVAVDPAHRSGQTVRMSAFLRHISIMHLLSRSYKPPDMCLRRRGPSLRCGDD
jgi:hypothetical protein